MSYSGVVCSLTNVRPFEGADRILLATVLGNQVVVGKDHKDGDLGIFFGTDGKFSYDMLLNNGLYNNSARQKLGLEPVEKPGFFDVHGRIRAQRFRGQRSDGIWLPLSSLAWTGVDPSTLKEGDNLTELGGYGICQKYYTPATLRALRGGTPRTRKEYRWFPKMEDVKQFRFVADDIPEDAVLYISEKLHGTSGRTAYVLDETSLPRWKQWLNTNLFHRGFFQPKQEYAFLNGSKNVVLGSSKDTAGGWYGTNEFRYNAAKVLEGNLRKGEVWYYEIVGWVNESTPIMPPHDVTKTGLKDIQKLYGDKIHYHYGVPVGEHRIYVYKICLVNEDGLVVEQPWTYVTRRCGELGLPHVPLLFGPTTLSHLAVIQQCEPHEALRRTVEQFTDGVSQLARIPQEGIVVRVESRLGISHLKNKSFSFGVMEGYIREKDDYVDLEETS